MDPVQPPQLTEAGLFELYGRTQMRLELQVQYTNSLMTRVQELEATVEAMKQDAAKERG